MNLPSLMYRRHRGDMIEVYKYLNDFYSIREEDRVVRKETRAMNLRNNGLPLSKEHSHLAARRNFFSQRVPHAWNMLPKTVVQAPTIFSFKSRLDKFLGPLKYSIEFPLVPRAERWEERHQKTNKPIEVEDARQGYL